MKEYVLYFEKNKRCCEKFFYSVEKLSQYIQRYIGTPKDYTFKKGYNYMAYSIECESLVDCKILFVYVYVQRKEV